jgi:hypothetical protein
MVSFQDVQTAYYMVAATGVLVAAGYYILNLRASQKNQELSLKAQQQTLETRRIGLMDSLIARTINKEAMMSSIKLLRYEWSDYEDFEKKYGTENDVEAAAERYVVWNLFDAFGMMLRKGMVEIEDVYAAASVCMFLWEKFKPIIEENRRRYNGQSYLRDFEYLYDEMMKWKLSKDPYYRVPDTLDKYVPDK